LEAVLDQQGNEHFWQDEPIEFLLLSSALSAAAIVALITTIIGLLL
jgi:hypothetical protein